MKHSVLIAEDEQEIREHLSAYLEDCQLGVLKAAGGRQALEIAVQEHPGIIIMDLAMPDMDGIELMRQLRRKLPGCCVIVMTGHGSDMTRMQMLRLGVQAYVTKPFDMEALYRRYILPSLQDGRTG